MTALWDFSELRESATLFDGLLTRRRRSQQTKQGSGVADSRQEEQSEQYTSEPASLLPPPPESLPLLPQPSELPTVAAQAIASNKSMPLQASPEPLLPSAPNRPTASLPLPAPPERADDGQFREDRLQDAIADLCRRAQFKAALVADSHGLPLAAHNLAIDIDAAGAFATVLGGAIERARDLLEYDAADSISIDVGFADKIIVRIFLIEEHRYHLLVLCSQDADAREEIELSVEAFALMLTASDRGSKT